MIHESASAPSMSPDSSNLCDYLAARYLVAARGVALASIGNEILIPVYLAHHWVRKRPFSIDDVET